jgi:hypothetical protein
MSHLLSSIMHFVEQMRVQDWVLVLAAMILVGAIFLRGFGSRTGY